MTNEDFKKELKIKQDLLNKTMAVQLQLEGQILLLQDLIKREESTAK